LLFRQQVNAVVAALVSSNSGSTAPDPTFPGMVWLDTSTTPAALKQRNAANDAWLSVLSHLGVTVTAAQINRAVELSARNAIINGNFGINQRGVSGTVTLAAGAYGHDRWKAGASGCTYTFATSGNVTTLTISAGSLIQVIEGINLFDGTYVLSWTGTAQGKIGAGSFGNSGITGSVTGGTDLNIEFDTGTVSLVQFEQGTVATPFEHRFIGHELSLCQRYHQEALVFVQHTAAALNNTLTANTPLQSAMRAAPTASEKTAITSTNVSTIFPPASVLLRADGAGIRVIAAGGGDVIYRAVWQFTAEL